VCHFSVHRFTSFLCSVNKVTKSVLFYDQGILAKYSLPRL
jgi:hypothetical protein